ncbi:MAG: TIGR03982 family His-Xaa-Ser system protein [Alphaproteobacteria bacterium]
MNKKTLGICLGFLTCFVAGMFAQDAKIALIKSVYAEKYTNLVFKCDQAMREHFISKQIVAQKPNKENANALMESEIALIDCQDYDMTRKKLLSFGLNESDLSELGLRAIEEKSEDIRKVVEIHEIRYD